MIHSLLKLTGIILFSLLCTTDIFSQNVGVDVAVPQQKLDVLGGIRIGNTTTGLAGSIRWTGTQFEGHDGSVWAPFGGSSTSWGLTGNSGTIPGTNFLGTTDNVDFRIRTNNTDKVTVNAAGNVGVGTTAPADKLDVFGTIKATNPGTSPNGSSIKLSSPANDIGVTMDRGNGSGSSQQRWDMKITSDNALRFRSQNTTDYFAFTNTGNMGIGTTVPAQVLDVNGKIQMRTGATAGYVPVSDANGTMTWTNLATSTTTYLDEIRDADNDTKVQVEESADEDIIRFDAAGSQLFSMRKLAAGSPWLEVNSSNTLIGNSISSAINNAYNTAVGFQSAQSLTSGQKNTYYGDNAGGFNTTGSNNTMLGTVAGQFNDGGSNNTMVGGYAGRNNLTGSGNVFLGFGAGENETTSNKLYLDNSNTTVPLIYGDFSSNILTVNGNLGINTTTPGQRLDVNGDARIQNGTLNLWAVNATEGGQINLADGNIDADGQTNAWSLDVSNNDFRVMDDGAVRAFFQDDGNLGIGTTVPAQKLDVNGKIQMRTGATTGYIPVSDANGTMTWTNPATINTAYVDEIRDADNDTKVQVEESADEDKIRFDLAGSEKFVMDGAHLYVKNSGSSVFMGDAAGLNDDLSNNNNVFIGQSAGTLNTTGADNTAVGSGALKANTTASFNTAIGWDAMAAGATANNSTAVGHWSLHSNVDGASNIAIGSHTLRDNVNGGTNVALGANAGQSNLGSGNVFLGNAAGQNETGSNKLYLDNSNTTTPLIYGDFSSNIITVNGNLGINTTTPGQRLDVNGDARIQNGTVNVWALSATEGGQINLADGNNDADGQTNAWSLDVSNNDFRVMDDGAVRAFFQDDGNLGIGTTVPAQKLDVNGKIQMRTGATTGYVPVSDANGTMTWTNPTSLTVTETDPQVSSATANYVPKWNGTTLVDGTIYDNGNIGIGTTTPTQKVDIVGGDLIVRKLSTGTSSVVTIAGSRTGGNTPYNTVNTTAPARLDFQNNDFADANTDYIAGRIESVNRPGINDGELRFYTSQNLVLQEAMNINNAGNVGIGTIASEKLHVIGNIRMVDGNQASGYIPVSDANGKMTWTNPATITTAYVDEIRDADNDTKIQVEENADEDKIRFDTQGTERMIIDNTGNVGIGVNSPSQVLDVNGRMALSHGFNNTNVYIGRGAAVASTTAYLNTALGVEALASITTSGDNTALGYRNMNALTTGGANSSIGSYALSSLTTGGSNVALGYGALNNLIDGSDNVAIGRAAGAGNTNGNRNVFIGFQAGGGSTGSDELYIDNSNTANPLIYGNFNTNLLRVNGTLNVNNAYNMPSVAGTNGYVLQTNGSGTASWVNSTTLSITETDPQVSSTNTNNIPKWNGISLVDGVAYDNGTNIGIGISTPNEILHIRKDGFDNYIRVDAGSPSANYSGIKLFEPGFDFGWYIRFDAVSDDLYFDHANGGSTTIMKLDNGGNVGIGTTSPGAYLDITGTNAGTTSLQLRSGNVGNGTNSNQVTFGFSGTENYRHTIKTRHNSGSDDNNALDFYVWDFGTDAAATIGTKRVMTIDGNGATGSVGIGTSAPAEELHVVGNIRMVDGNQAANKVMVSDANGTATWTDATSLTISETDPQVSVATTNQIPKWNGTTLTDGIVTDNGTNVGIGSTTPGSKLDVIGTARATDVMANGTSGNLMLSNSNTSATDYFRIDGNADKLYVIAESGASGNVTGTEIRFRTANTNATAADRMTINNNGNVGIGTSEPVNKLDVEGSLAVGANYSGSNIAPSNGAIIEGNVGIGTSGPSEMLHVYRNTSDAIIKVESPGGLYDARILFQKNGSNTANVGFFPGTAELRLRTGQATGILFEPNGVERMRVDFDGEVGIGTTNPAYKLDVSGGSIGSGDNYYFTNTSGTGTTPFRIDGFSDKLQIIAENGADGNASGTEIRFRTASTNSSAADRMTINNNGNIGIATTSPADKLHVVGNIRMVDGNQAANKVMVSDANGTASWANATSLTVTETDPQVSSASNNQVPKWNGTTLTDGIITDNATNVGIGSATPGAKLDVIGTARATDVMANGTTGNLMLSNSNTSATDYFRIDGTSDKLYVIAESGSAGSVTGTEIRFRTATTNATATDKATINNNGNVGIGTTSPTEIFHVQRNTSDAIVKIESPGSSYDARLVFQKNGSNNATVGFFPGTAELRLRTGQATGILFEPDGVERMRVHYDGTVGIGTISPAYKLDVAGGSIGSGDNYYFTNTSGTGTTPFRIDGFSDQLSIIAENGPDGNASGTEIRMRTAAANSTAVDRLTINNTGNVGIGTTAPASNLEVQGASGANAVVTIDQHGADQYTGVNIQRDATEQWFVGMNNADDDFIIRVDAANDYVTIKNSDGNVGIGTTAPTFDLDIYKNETAVNQRIYANDASGIGHLLTGASGGGHINLIANSSAATYLGVPVGVSGVVTDHTDMVFATGTSGTGTEQMRITTGGNVGIGSNNPTQAKLVVNGSQTSNPGNYGYLNSSTPTGTSGAASNPYSIYASARIAATEFNAYSDQRIKSITGISDSRKDLETLMNIAITDYTFIDKVEKGNGNQKKVIAQQVEKIYPQAVSTITDVVPDIYKIAEINSGRVIVANNLKAGEKVKLIFENRSELVEVITADVNGFNVNLPDNGQVFVFGHEVNDFRTVDYEALSTLNISATQELVRMMNQLKNENTEMKNKFSALSSDVEILKSMLNADTKAEK